MWRQPVTRPSGNIVSRALKVTDGYQGNVDVQTYTSVPDCKHGPRHMNVKAGAGVGATHVTYRIKLTQWNCIVTERERQLKAGYIHC